MGDLEERRRDVSRRRRAWQTAKQLARHPWRTFKQFGIRGKIASGLAVTANLIAIVTAIALCFKSDPPPPPPPPDVRIDVAASRIDAPDYDDPAREYICLVNAGAEPVDLTGWTLSDAEGVVNVLPHFTLPAHGSVRVHPGRGADSATDLFGTTRRPTWNNTNDTVTLEDASGTEIDALGYGPQRHGSGSCGPAAAP